MFQSEWQNKKVAFLGDSITDKLRDYKTYWELLEENPGIKALGYGVNGQRWEHVISQAKRLLADHGTDVDAIFIFMGTNDYMCAVPPGEWYTHQVQETNAGGVMVKRLRRILSTDNATFCGRINNAMAFLNETFPLQQIILMTPIHRAFAAFSESNVQPEETFPNELGLYVDTYIRLIREAADIWSCPLIDLYRTSGLHPLTASHGMFFQNAETDRLHPGETGHKRLAATIRAQMHLYPPTFR